MRRLFVIFIAVLCIFVSNAPAQTTPPPGGHYGVSCTVCHVTPDTYVVNANIPDNACYACHAQGTPGTAGGGSDLKVTAHYSDNFNDPTTGILVDIKCVECHNPMNVQSNLKSVRNTIRTKSVVFTSYSGPNSFADGGAPYNGICEVCHSQTNHHQMDGTAPGGQSHNDGTNCRDCHSHLESGPPPLICTDNDGDGFAPQGSTCGPVDCNDTDPAVRPFILENCSDGIDNNCDSYVDINDAACGALFTMLGIGTLGGDQSQARAISSGGQLVGFAATSARTSHAFSYFNGTMTDLGVLSGNESWAQDVNSTGQIVGYSMFDNGGGSFSAHPMIYENGIMSDLGIGVGWAFGINDAGQIVGGTGSTAFMYDNGIVTDLGSLGGDGSTAYDINNNGQIVGFSRTAAGYLHAFLYENGSMSDLGTLGGDTSFANAINDSGQVVGYSRASDGMDHAFLYENGIMHDIGSPGTDSSAQSINNLGYIVGHAQFGSETHAFLYKNGVMRDLGTLGGSWSRAWDINDNGEIVGQSMTTEGSLHAFVWRGTLTDSDADGHLIDVDCNDNDADIHPGAPDTNCNGVDENCSGTADEGYAQTASTCGIGACTSTGQNVCQNGVTGNTCTPGTPQTEGPYGNATCTDGIDNDCDGATDGLDSGCIISCTTNSGCPAGSYCSKGCSSSGICKALPASTCITLYDPVCGCDNTTYGNSCEADRVGVSIQYNGVCVGCIDNDGDGYGANGNPGCLNGTAVDCNDNNANVNPGKTDIPCNGIDDNCNGQVDESLPQNSYYRDADADGYGSPTSIVQSCTHPAGYVTNNLDCDDSDPKVFPRAPRICDGKDNDCDGRLDFSTDIDNDGDGAALCKPDCNDNNPNMYPGNPEIGDQKCHDGIDNDCDKKIDMADPDCLGCIDKDLDGYGSNGHPLCPNGTAIDCNDSNANIHPNATDGCNNIDDDCDGSRDEDHVVTSTTCGTGACTASGQNTCVNGVVTDTCVSAAPQQEGPMGDASCADSIDNDCDGAVDGADPNCLTPCLDADGDGYGANGDPSCPNGTAIDCNDINPVINPGASDSNCNGVDENCSGTPDDGFVPTQTNCGTGECARTGQNICQNGSVVNTCSAGTPQTEGPTGSPICSDGKDNDCDGLTDIGDPDCRNDFDQDGYTTAQGDCDDTDPKVYPRAPRICDGKDNDCDGRRDFSTDVDNDRDGFPICVMTGQLKGDCNDNNANINPGVMEIQMGILCIDGIDNDCDGKVDIKDPGCIDECIDQDGDGYGYPGHVECPAGSATDCNDKNHTINPGALDTSCNGIDENCNGTKDEGYVPTPTVCGVGQCAATGQNICQNGTIVNTCTPGVPQTESCMTAPASCSDGIDNDCDGLSDASDAGCNCNACIDEDGDGYGLNGHATCPMGTAIDCNDNDSNINPGAPDTTCNGIDENCSGAADEDYIPALCFSGGIGACAATGHTICQNGEVICDYPYSIYPMPEHYTSPVTCSNGIDDDCDGLTDDQDPDCNPINVDNDHDGYCEVAPCIDGSAGGDCDDTDNKVFPGAATICDGKDNNCDGRRDFSTDVDNDKDGFPICVKAGYSKGDCNDNNPNINPGVLESPYGSPLCSDGFDNDCDLKTDGADPGCLNPCKDADGDGYVSCDSVVNGCQMPPSCDCNDNNPNINPSAPDTNCNGIDENCDNDLDDGYIPTPTVCGIGGCASTGQITCQNGSVVNTCVPLTPGQEGPFGDATCSDALDNDCDGKTDSADIGCQQESCIDNDRDGCGDGCPCPDCDDMDNKVYPGAAPICDGKDNDCDGRLDFPTDVDNDHDGWPICILPGQTRGDCNDNNPNINPGQYENDHCGQGPLCSDGLDNDCNNKIDLLEPNCDCADCDHDGYPAVIGPINTCIYNTVDCNDSNAAINPGVFEGPAGDPTCTDGADNNCNGLIDASDSACM